MQETDVVYQLSYMYAISHVLSDCLIVCCYLIVSLSTASFALPDIYQCLSRLGSYAGRNATPTTFETSRTLQLSRTLTQHAWEKRRYRGRRSVHEGLCLGLKLVLRL